MVPTMIGMMLEHPEFEPERLASLRMLTYGASPMPEALLEKLLELFPDLELFQGYGMTEASAVTTVLTPEDHRRGGTLLRSAGRAVPGVSISIQDAEGNVLPTGEIGEVCARRAPSCASTGSGRRRRPRTFRGGWYHTGDAGYLDEEGYLFLVDRVKDMIVTGGENVYSAEVENAIAQAPGGAAGRRHRHPEREVGRGGARRSSCCARARRRPRTRSSSTAATGSPATRCRSRSSSATEPLPLSGAMKVAQARAARALLGGQGARSIN